MSNKVYILGGAQTDFERNWTKEGKNFIAMLKEAVADGFEEAGFSFDELTRLNKDNRVCAFVGNFIAEQYISQGHLGAFLTEVHPAFYGVPSDLMVKATESLPEDIVQVIETFDAI